MTDDDVTTVEVCVPNRESSSQINSSLAKTLESLETPDDGEYDVSVRHSYMQPVDANRNKMVKNFLKDEDNDWLLMVDNDVVPPANILEMIEYGKPVVSAAVTIKKGSVPQPIILVSEGDQYRQVNLSEYVDKEEGDYINVDAVGTGCILIRRDVLEDMKPPWFKFKYNEEGGLALGEDFYFSKRLEQSDVPMYVSTQHVCRHFKKIDLTEVANVVAEYQKRLNKLQNILDEEGIDYNMKMKTPDFPVEGGEDQ